MAGSSNTRLLAHSELSPPWGCPWPRGLRGTGLAAPRVRGWGPGGTSPLIGAIPRAERPQAGRELSASAGAGCSCPLIPPLLGQPAPCRWPAQPSPTGPDSINPLVPGTQHQPQMPRMQTVQGRGWGAMFTPKPPSGLAGPRPLGGGPSDSCGGPPAQQTAMWELSGRWDWHADHPPPSPCPFPNNLGGVLIRTPRGPAQPWLLGPQYQLVSDHSSCPQSLLGTPSRAPGPLVFAFPSTALPERVEEGLALGARSCGHRTSLHLLWDPGCPPELLGGHDQPVLHRMTTQCLA